MRPEIIQTKKSFFKSPLTTMNVTQTSIPGIEYFLLNGDIFHSKDKMIPTTCRSRLGAEGIQEVIHERFFAKLYHENFLNVVVLDSNIGKYENKSFPPYLGHVVPSGETMVWEIREQYFVPALRWVLRGLVKSGHIEEVSGSLSEGISDDAPVRTSFSAGIVIPNHKYYYNETFPPLDVLDEKEILRKRRQDAVSRNSDSSSEEEIELSAYEQMRADRVARNAERLKVLGLA